VLDEIALAIGGLVERMEPLAGRVVWNDRDRSLLERETPQSVAVIGGVIGETTAPWNGADQSRSDPDIAAMARRHFDGEGRPRASTMAWIFVVRPPRERPIPCDLRPPFPPAAERWALAVVLNMA
jgi:hypothetical protein